MLNRRCCPPGHQALGKGTGRWSLKYMLYTRGVIALSPKPFETETLLISILQMSKLTFSEVTSLVQSHPTNNQES